MALLVDYANFDVEVYIRDTLAWVHEKTAQGLEVVLPSLPAGLHRISVSINGVDICSEGWGGHLPLVLGLFDGLAIQLRNASFELGLFFFLLLRLGNEHENHTIWTNLRDPIRQFTLKTNLGEIFGLTIWGMENFLELKCYGSYLGWR